MWSQERCECHIVRRRRRRGGGRRRRTYTWDWEESFNFHYLTLGCRSSQQLAISWDVTHVVKQFLTIVLYKASCFRSVVSLWDSVDISDQNVLQIKLGKHYSAEQSYHFLDHILQNLIQTLALVSYLDWFSYLVTPFLHSQTAYTLIGIAHR